MRSCTTVLVKCANMINVRRKSKKTYLALTAALLASAVAAILGLEGTRPIPMVEAQIQVQAVRQYVHDIRTGGQATFVANQVGQALRGPLRAAGAKLHDEINGRTLEYQGNISHRGHKIKILNE